MKKGRYYLFWLGCTLLFFPGSVFGAETLLEEGLSVTPVFQEVSFEAEDVQGEFTISLNNKTTQPVTLQTSVVDFGSLDESGGVAFVGAADNLERKYSLASWMRPEKERLFLDGGESEDIRVVIENRESLTPGGHYGAVLFQVEGEKDTSGAKNIVSVNQFVSVLVFAKKKGGEIFGLDLQGKEWERNLFFMKSPLRLRFYNPGNVHVVPRGTVRVTDPFGRVVQKGSINPESGLILPESNRAYAVTLKEMARLFFPGQYTLAVSYRYDGRDIFSYSEERFFFFPWEGTLGAVCLVGGVWFLVATLKKRRKQAIKK